LICLLEIVDLANEKIIPELKFMIIGDGSYRNKFVDKKNVVFLSWVPEISYQNI